MINCAGCWRRGYHTIAKGASNRRAEALARQVRRWDAFEDYWLGEVPAPVDYGRPVRVLRQKTLQRWLFSAQLLRFHALAAFERAIHGVLRPAWRC